MANHDLDEKFDLSDLDAPVIVTEETVVISEGPYEVDELLHLKE